MAQVLYLGPSGTFTYDAARRYFPDRDDTDFSPCASPQEVIRCVSESNDYGVVPIENSVHGEVITTLDALLFEFASVYIVGEISLPITFSFFSTWPSAQPGIVLSHPHALAQCKHFIHANGLTEQVSNSTADACRIVAERRDPAFGAIASSSAGENFNLTSLADEIEDFKGAQTRFLVLSRHFAIPDGVCKFAAAILPPSNDRGVLAELTSTFSNHQINILSIHSRPTKIAVGHYVFIVMAQGNPAFPPTANAFNNLYDQGYRVKMLGVYAMPSNLGPASPFHTLPGVLTKREFETLMTAGDSLDE